MIITQAVAFNPGLCSGLKYTCWLVSGGPNHPIDIGRPSQVILLVGQYSHGITINPKVIIFPASYLGDIYR